MEILACSEDEINKSIEINVYSEQCNLLKMTSLPTFGQYSDDYTFLEQILILKSESQPDYLTQNIKLKIDNLKKSHPDVDPEYFHITLSTSTLISPSSENEIKTDYTLLNLICHPYIFYDCELNKEHRTEIYCSAFYDDLEIDTLKEAEEKDNLRINPECNLDDYQLKRELILHLSKEGYPSLSPNNCGILINLNAQIINFYVIVCGTYGGNICKCFVGHYIIIPNAINSVLFGDIYNQMIKEKTKEKLGIDLIIFRNKFNEFMNFIFNFGLNEIVLNAKNLDHIKLCINKAFSYIFDFSINGDKDDDKSKKIHEKELINMQNYYYNNVCNFICNLYKYSKYVDPNFGEKYMESCLKKKYLEELLCKYSQYLRSRINKIILSYLYFIYENENLLEDLQEKADEIYKEDILPNLKTFFQNILNQDEENLNEINDNYSEDNRIHIGNPYIEILINICNAIRNEDDIDMDELDDIVKKYLFYIVWDYKNRPCGIHNDFGRVSFMNCEIDGKFYCNNDDKINCCQKLIQYLENADEKHY